LDFEISLNGVDFTSSGLKYSYMIEPVIYNISADSGQARGGTVIYINGKNFPRIINSSHGRRLASAGSYDMHVRFRPQSLNMAAKYTPCNWLNDTTLEVITPGGW